MKLKLILIFVLFSLLLGLGNAVKAVDKNSIFRDARIPASLLDIKLSTYELRWWINYVKMPSAETKKEHSLITKTGLALDLAHYESEDYINVTGWITNLDGFLSLSKRERKQLVYNTMEKLEKTMYGTIHLKSNNMLEKKHFKFNVIISDVIENDKNENIRSILPDSFGLTSGQAAYKDGEYIFSVPYFTELEIKNGVAVAGDSENFEIEQDR